MADLPLEEKQDQTKYNLSLEDTGLRSQMEGGYVITRPRHTRKPRRTLKTGWTGLLQKDFDTFYAFYLTKGTYSGFTYKLKHVNEIINVRFKEPPTFNYDGVGVTKLWNIEITLEEI